MSNIKYGCTKEITLSPPQRRRVCVYTKFAEMSRPVPEAAFMEAEREMRPHKNTAHDAGLECQPQGIPYLTLPMLRLLLCIAQGCKDV